MTLRKRPEILWERNHILSELVEPSPVHRHVIQLHMIKSHNTRFYHSGVREQLAKFLVREIPTRIHTVLHAPQRDGQVF